MARDTASLIRAPAVLRRPGEFSKGERGDGDDGRPRLRLVVTKGRLGVELERPFVLGFVSVTELALSLPDARFPVELSGGIGSFRHRRGELERISIELATSRQNFASELRGLLDDTTPELMLAPIEDGWLVGLRGQQAVLAFEVVIAAADDDLRLIPVAARGIGLSLPPQALALSILASLTRPIGRQHGAAIVIERASRELAQAVLPLAGMRCPATEAMRWSPAEPRIGALSLRASLEPPSAPSARAIRAVELASLAADAEAALSRGDMDETRSRYLAALERAPRHPELARRLAEIDRCQGRIEVALGVLGDLGLAVDAGPLAGELFAGKGDRDAARSVFERASEEEPYGPLAAACSLRMAELCEGHLALEAIDRAIARAPGWEELRWRRFELRLRAGDVQGALADAGELEAGARGAATRYEVARRVADRLLIERHLAGALAWFERALRYRPDAADAVVGLARSLAMLGHRRRALELHARAVALGKKTGPAHRMVLELARALVEVADDRPAAIAHVRSVPALVPEAFEARLLEARWRAQIGDKCGASEALARLGDEVERALGALVEPHDPAYREQATSALCAARRDLATSVATLLEEGATIEEQERGDRLAAGRLLSLAIRLDPRRPAIQAAFRRVAEVVRDDQRVGVTSEASPAAPVAVEVADDGGMDELLVEQLSDQLRANPSDMAVVLRLADVLERLGRDHDLLALLSARIDEEGEPVRRTLLPRRRAVLGRLRDAAIAEGRTGEVELYRLMLARD